MLWEQAAVLQEMKVALQDFPAQEEQEQRARWKLTLFAKQIGLNISDLPEEEIAVLMKALRRSEKYKQGRRQGRRRR